MQEAFNILKEALIIALILVYYYLEREYKLEDGLF
jgi:hypothetical protein